MKKPYIIPQLTMHGSIEDITQAYGRSGASDTFEFNGKTFPGSVIGASGSRDGVVIPK
ncbi:MAG: lasso peptide [Calothrix sp. MO_167.B12]|nr:lasso peptide [Calothrix sp. MO_167.B12]